MAIIFIALFEAAIIPQGTFDLQTIFSKSFLLIPPKPNLQIKSWP